MENKFDDVIKRGKTLSEQVYDALYSYISQLPENGTRLPSEDDLAKKYGVSRAIIREACNQLRMEGCISKRNGRGMSGHPSACRLKNRIDLVSDFRKLIAQSCEHVDLLVSDVSIQDTRTYQSLFPTDPVCGEVFCMTWTYYGDGDPLILGKFEIPLSSFRTIPALDFSVHDLTEFSEEYLKIPIAFCAMQIHCAIDPQAAEIFSIDPNRPMQCWRETLYDLEDHSAGRSLFYLHPDKMVMSVLTKFQ